MKTKKYTQLKENVIEDVLPNGLRVSLVPKNNYHKTFAVITTEYGALDTAFQINNEEPIIIPPGTAHFLEHKLFEKEDGDAFAGFGVLGADANAFTNAYQTSYLFSTSQNFSSALSYLLDFVQAPYFTQQTVAKEQGIIGQEIQMYADDPNWKVYMGLLNLMYPDTSLATDIAGTQASIALITPELLYQIHRAFYQPSQLHLQIVGRFDPDEILALIHQNQAQKVIESVDVKKITNEINTPREQNMTASFSVVRPKVAFGLRIQHDILKGEAGAKMSEVADIVNDMLFGEQTDWYQSLYSQGIIDTEFSVSYDLIREYQFVSIIAETTEIVALTEAIQKRLDQYQEVLLESRESFEQIRRATLGEGIQRLNSLESIALRGDDVLFGINLFDQVMLIQNLTFEDILTGAEILYRTVHLQRFILQQQ